MQFFPVRLLFRKSWLKTIAGIKRSVFPLAVARVRQGEAPVLEEIRVAGSGFFVGEEGYFVTAGHVARAFEATGNAQPRRTGVILVPQLAWGRANETFDVTCLRFEISHIDEDSDLALCRTVENPFLREQTSNFVRPVVLDTAVPPDGTGVGFTGFPINNRIPIFAKGILASYQGFRNRGLVLLVHADSWPGVSGGPVYLRGGQVIGIITARGQKEFQGVTLARPATFIKALLEANRVAH